MPGLIVGVKLPDRCVFNRSVKDAWLHDFRISSLNGLVLSNIFGSALLEDIETLLYRQSN